MPDLLIAEQGSCHTFSDSRLTHLGLDCMPHYSTPKHLSRQLPIYRLPEGFRFPPLHSIDKPVTFMGCRWQVDSLNLYTAVRLYLVLLRLSLPNHRVLIYCECRPRRPLTEWQISQNLASIFQASLEATGWDIHFATQVVNNLFHYEAESPSAGWLDRYVTKYRTRLLQRHYAYSFVLNIRYLNRGGCTTYPAFHPHTF
jgi:hypothetical protein